ncbi:MAG: hypothetical protein ACUVT6_12360 [Thermodesulfobacteriota bacterium]
MLIIGESINGTIQKVGQAILERNESFLRELAKTQFSYGAQMLDINTGVAGEIRWKTCPGPWRLSKKKLTFH